MQITSAKKLRPHTHCTTTFQILKGKETSSTMVTTEWAKTYYRYDFIIILEWSGGFSHPTMQQTHVELFSVHDDKLFK